MAERLVDDWLQRDLAAAAELAVGGDDRDGARVDDALLHALRGKAAEHHRVRGADARAGLHRHDRLDRHRHVDEDAIALLDAERLQRVGEAADVVVERLVGDLGDRAVVGLEDDRDLVGLRRQVPVEAVVRGVQLAVVEPLEERRVGFVERLRERLVPQHVLARMPRPEALEVALGFRAHRLVGGHAGDVRLLDEGLGRRKYAVFLQDRFDTGRHGALSSVNCDGLMFFTAGTRESNQTAARGAMTGINEAINAGATGAAMSDRVAMVDSSVARTLRRVRR